MIGRLRRPWILLLTALLAWALTAAPPARADTACAPDPVRCPAALYYGVSLPGRPGDLGALAAYGQLVGRAPTVVNYFASFADNLDSAALTTLTSDHRLPMVTWSPTDPRNPTGNSYPLASLAAGAYDGYLIRQARLLATVPGPVAVRFAEEMNGSWFPWGRGVNGNTDADFVAAWRHVHDVLSANGAGNVIWVWAPGATVPATDLAPLYPGAAYVDWVGLSVYLDTGTETYAQLMDPTVANLNTFAPTKPIYIAETGVLPGPQRPAQLTDLLTGLIRLPRLVGISWFEQPGRFDWRVDSDPASLAALRTALASPWFRDAGDPSPLLVAPLSQITPTVSGTAAVNSTLTGTSGVWRSAPAAGATTLAGGWYRCTDPTDTGSCAPIAGATQAGYTVTAADWNRYLRYHVTAGNSAGTTEKFSIATGAVLMQPSSPTAPVIESENTALRVTFPAVPLGATHWVLTVDGTPTVPVPVSTATYWLVGLTTGRSYSVALQAVDLTPSGSRYSAPVTVSALPVTGPSTPGVVVTGGTAAFSLPVAPTGASAWLLTLDGVRRTLPVGTRSWSSPAAPGTPGRWPRPPARARPAPGAGGRPAPRRPVVSPCWPIRSRRPSPPAAAAPPSASASCRPGRPAGS